MSGARAIDWRALVIPAAGIAGAEIAGSDSTLLAAPSSIVAAFGAALSDGTVVLATAATLATSVAGLALGSAVGLAIGVLLGLFRAADRVMELPVEMLRPIPAVALIPVALLGFGFGYRLEIAITAFACLWPMLVLSRAAVAGVEPRLLAVGRALGFGTAARIWKIVLPAALPRIFVAFRLCAGIALIVAVTVEVAANPLGLGYGMMLAQQTLRPNLMLALLVWLGIIGWALNLLLLRLQARIFGPMASAGSNS